MDGEMGIISTPTLGLRFIYNYMDKLNGRFNFWYFIPFPVLVRCCDVIGELNKKLKIMLDIQKKISNICGITAKMNIFVSIT